eukprot:m.1613093 g.1613093  ORF g.1613093 m.1613093 type:complete len:222 (+) comp25368_c0_seq79:181-846(+)
MWTDSFERHQITHLIPNRVTTSGSQQTLLTPTPYQHRTMSKFTTAADPLLMKLRWLSDDNQDHESFNLWYRMVVLHASSHNGGLLMRGLLDVDSPVHEGQAAATFSGIVCVGGAMRAIVEECDSPNDGFTMFSEIKKHYDDQYRPLAHSAAVAFFNLPHHNGLTLTEYAVKITRTSKLLQSQNPELYSDVHMLEHMLTTGDNNEIRTPPEITPCFKFLTRK